MSHLIRVRNDSLVAQTFYLDGGAIRVVPKGTALIPANHPALNIREFTRIGEVDAPAAPTASAADEALRAQVAALQAELERLRAQPAAASPAPVTYPENLNGGKWRLSNGEITKGGTSRIDAEALEAELHE
jgi:hypothetical protein